MKKSSGKLYWYASGLDAIAESDLAGNNMEEYVFFQGKRVARRKTSGAVEYYFADHLGTSRVVTNSTGGQLDDQDFYPYGAIVPGGTSTSGQNYKFTGKERDGESGLDYFIARHYGSNWGRFLQADEFTGGPVDAFSTSDPLPPGPLPYGDITNPQSLNKYAYTWNNPTRYVDPDGHWLETAWDAFNLTLGVYSLQQNLDKGNYGAAAIDAIGIGIDTAAALVPVVPGGAGAGIKLLRGASSVWDLPAVKRGFEIGQKLGQNLPEWFPVIDKFSDGVATSIKSIDLGAASYQDTGRLTNVLQRYVDKLADFKGAKRGEIEITADAIQSRVLELAVEPGRATNQQRAALEAIREYATTRGVDFRIVEIQ